MAARGDGGLRADAARNRDRLVAAAREVFAEHGIDVSMRQVALHAGVSEPTLRRRFATKADLVSEAFSDQVSVYADAAEEALGNPDAWAGFTGFVRRIARMQLADRGFTEVLTITLRPGDAARTRHRRGRSTVNVA